MEMKGHEETTTTYPLESNFFKWGSLSRRRAVSSYLEVAISLAQRENESDCVGGILLVVSRKTRGETHTANNSM
jgi:hypothetical protein